HRLTLAQAVYGLACPPTRVEHAVAVVDHDDRLPALLDEHSPASGIGVRHVTAFSQKVCGLRASTSRCPYSHLGECMRPRKGVRMKGKAIAVLVGAGVLVPQHVAPARGGLRTSG